MLKLLLRSKVDLYVRAGFVGPPLSMGLGGGETVLMIETLIVLLFLGLCLEDNRVGGEWDRLLRYEVFVSLYWWMFRGKV